MPIRTESPLQRQARAPSRHPRPMSWISPLVNPEEPVVSLDSSRSILNPVETMATTSSDLGGTHLFKGALHQVCGIVLYMLVRRQEHPRLKIEVEHLEDAVFTYPIDARHTVVELVQCKQTQSSAHGDVHQGYGPSETWIKGEFSFGDLKHWMTLPRKGYVAEEYLATHPNSYFTALLFGATNSKLKKFLTAFPGALRSISAEFSKAFPVDYVHSSDPNPTTKAARNFGARTDVRQRTRLLLLDSPPEVELQCRRILETTYRVSVERSAHVVNDLQKLILEKHTASDRVVRNQDLEVIIASGRRGLGKWRDATEAGYLDRGNTIVADLNRGERPRWADFASPDFRELRLFKQAWLALQNQPIIISGPLGAGKSTLCRYLAYKYLSAGDARRAYYLEVHAGDTIEDEISFLEQSINDDVLFIVDDEHLAHSSVEQLVTQFRKYFDLDKAKPLLAVTSGITYSRGQAVVRGRILSPLNQLLPLSFQSAEFRRECKGLIDYLLATDRLKSNLSSTQLDHLGGGNVGLCLLCARCAAFIGERHVMRLLRDTRHVSEAAVDWILRTMDCPEDHDVRRDTISLLFLSAHALPIPTDFLPESSRRLHSIGILKSGDRNATPSQIYEISDHHIAVVATLHLSDTETAAVLDALSAYIERYPHFLVVVCEQLSARDARDRSQARGLLRTLLDKNWSTLLEVLSGDLPVLPHQAAILDLRASSRLLRCLYSVNRAQTRRLLQLSLAPRGDPSVIILSKMLRAERVRTLQSITSFFNVATRIADYEFRGLLRTQFGPREKEFILCCFELFPLNEVGGCLRAIHACLHLPAKQLLTATLSSGWFVERLKTAGEGPLQVFVWVTFCEQIKPINRRSATQLIEQQLGPDRIVAAVLTGGEIYRWSVFLLRLRKLHPRLASDVARTLSKDHREQLHAMLREQRDLLSTTGELYTLSRLDRREASRIAHELRDHITTLLSQEPAYTKIGAALNSLAARIGKNFAAQCCDAIDHAAVTDTLIRENRRINLVGMFLAGLHDIRPDLAALFQKEVESIYPTLGECIVRHPLLHWVRLVRGLIIAAAPEHRPTILGKILDDVTIRRDLHKGLLDANNLSEVAFCLARLLDIPMSRSDILRLVDFSTREDLVAGLVGRLRSEKSEMHVANFLWALAKFDGALAARELDGYVARIEVSAEEQSSEARLSRRAGAGGRRLRRALGSANLEELGSILRVAAAIDSDAGHRIAGLIDLGALGGQINSQPHLGRVVELLTGLAQASRQVTLELLPQISSEETLLRQMDENEDVQNLFYYSIAIGRVSRRTCLNYTLLALNHAGDAIEASAKVEANLMLISNGLRWMKDVEGSTRQTAMDGLLMSLQGAREYDSDVFHLLEATHATIECGVIPEARGLAELTLRSAGQLRSLRRLHDWVMLFHKATFIARGLGASDFVDRLFSSVSDIQFSLMLAAETNSVLRAYSYGLRDELAQFGVTRFHKLLDRARPQFVQSSLEEPVSIYRAAALTMMDAGEADLMRAADELKVRRPWEVGLLSLLNDSSRPGKEDPWLSRALEPVAGEPQSGLTAHLSNLLYGLSLRTTSRSIREDLEEEAFNRAADESTAAVVWLLENPYGAAKVPYVWFCLKETLLRATYLAWEDRIDDDAFRDMQLAVASR